MTKPYTCPKCGGVGVLIYNPADPHGQSVPNGPWPCPPCHAMGIIWGTHDDKKPGTNELVTDLKAQLMRVDEILERYEEGQGELIVRDLSAERRKYLEKDLTASVFLLSKRWREGSTKNHML